LEAGPRIALAGLSPASASQEEASGRIARSTAPPWPFSHIGPREAAGGSFMRIADGIDSATFFL